MIYRTISAFLLAFLILSSGLLPVMANMQAGVQNQPLLSIAGKAVPKEELIYLISKNSSIESGEGLSREAFEENFNLFVNFKLKVTEAENRNLDQSIEFDREFETFKENLKAPFLIKNSLEEGELRKAYSRMQEVIRASHVLIQFPPNPSSDDSLAVLRMALKVKHDVEHNVEISDLASKYSDDPSAKVNKGDLGYFTSLQMVQSFEEAAYSLQMGQVSDPVLTNFGYHIIQVKDRQSNPGQVRVSHLLIRVDEISQLGEDQARRKIADIYTEVQKESTTWEDIVKTYTEDPASKQTAGNLPWFSVGSMIPEFEIAAFSLTEIGEISPPIRTPYGYHIIRLEDKKPLDTFEEMEELIRSKILRNSRSVMIQSQVMSIQKARYGFDENEANIKYISNNLNHLKSSDFIHALEQIDQSKMSLFSLIGKSYTSDDLVNFIKESEIRPKSSQGIFDAWYEKFTAKKLEQAEEEDLLNNNQEYQVLQEEYREGILLFSLMNEEVWQKGIQDSIGQMTYFRQNIRNYQWKDRINTCIVKVKDTSQLEIIRDELSVKSLGLDKIDDLEFTQKTTDPPAFEIESGDLEIETHPILSKLDLKKPFQEYYFEGIPHLILLGKKTAAGAKKLGETRGSLIRDYQEFLDKSLLQSLSEKYPILIDPQVKEEVFINLNKK